MTKQYTKTNHDQTDINDRDDDVMNQDEQVYIVILLYTLVCSYADARSNASIMYCS